MNPKIWLFLIYYVLVNQPDGSTAVYQYEGMTKTAISKMLASEGKHFRFVTESTHKTVLEKIKLDRENRARQKS